MGDWLAAGAYGEFAGWILYDVDVASGVRGNHFLFADCEAGEHTMIGAPGFGFETWEFKMSR
jgi:hypothetical protein